MIDPELRRDIEQMFEHQAEIGRGHVADVLRSKTHAFRHQHHLQSGVAQAGEEMLFALSSAVRSGKHSAVRGSPSTRIGTGARRYPSPGVRAVWRIVRSSSSLSRSCRLYRSAICDRIIAIADDDKFPGLRIAAGRRGARRFQEEHDLRVGNRLVFHVSGSGGASVPQHLEQLLRLDRRAIYVRHCYPVVLRLVFVLGHRLAASKQKALPGRQTDLVELGLPSRRQRLLRHRRNRGCLSWRQIT